ncbi:MAG TPA: GNAT family N-acetyltransferase [Anaerolineae bacterium]|nr:GNAT family N-acetyltransferase [Anaerolineae bacterium]HQH37463.1 GNAT family N-acetyltransferase [Anaerolineae bacterium]
MDKTTALSIHVIPAAELSHDRLVILLNQAYAHYYLPVWMNEEQFEQMCYTEDMNLCKSVVAVIDDMPVGIALLSIRDNAGWVSGVGVIAPWRRHGIAQRLIKRLQATAQATGLQTLQLEVLAQNEAGLALYQQLGFVWERDLLVLTLGPGTFDPAPLPPGVAPIPSGVALASYAAFHEVRSPWQRQLASLQHRQGDFRALGFWDGARLVGYVLYHLQHGNHVVMDIGVDPGHPQRLSVAQTLLTAMHSARPDLGGYIINLPTDDPLLPAFTGFHYRTWQRQHELVWKVEE